MPFSASRLVVLLLELRWSSKETLDAWRLGPGEGVLELEEIDNRYYST